MLLRRMQRLPVVHKRQRRLQRLVEPNPKCMLLGARGAVHHQQPNLLPGAADAGPAAHACTADATADAGVALGQRQLCVLERGGRCTVHLLPLQQPGPDHQLRQLRRSGS